MYVVRNQTTEELLAGHRKHTAKFRLCFFSNHDQPHRFSYGESAEVLAETLRSYWLLTLQPRLVLALLGQACHFE